MSRKDKRHFYQLNKKLEEAVSKGYNFYDTVMLSPSVMLRTGFVSRSPSELVEG